jgi:hypothetical protein
VTERTSFCPNCGAPVSFRWSSSVQTVCTFCKSILVRTDVDIKRVGQVADLPPDASPIQINTEGTYDNRSFVVVGRIVYQYDQGGWNEWHIVFNDGTDGWLSDAQDEYMISFAKNVPNLPAQNDATLGTNYRWNDIPFTVTSRTLAHYAGVEGELPFQYWDKQDVAFVDLRSHANDFGTLDYSDEQPVLYLGKAVDFDDLRLVNTRKFESW